MCSSRRPLPRGTGDLNVARSTQQWPSGSACIAVGSDTQANNVRGVAMIFITTYRIKQLSKDETKELMGVFADNDVPSTAKARYVSAAGSHVRCDLGER